MREDAPVYLAPWEAEPYRLWSLWDMVRFYNATFMTAWGDFNRNLALLWTEGDKAIPEFETAFLGLLAEVTENRVPLSAGTAEQFKLLKMQLDLRDKSSDDQLQYYDGTCSHTVTALAVIARSLLNGVLSDLTNHAFLRIPPSRKWLYLQKTPPFGEKVANKFPESARDIAAAARCLALDEWTACVFHLMRALEQPLHALAARVQVTFPKPIEFENWKNIIDKIDSEIAKETKRLEGTSASHERNELLRMYGEASLQMRHFKNAWRNDAAHGREHYDEREGDRVYEAVKGFMQMMADLA